MPYKAFLVPSRLEILPDDAMPDWLSDGIRARDIRISDDLAYVRDPDGDWVTAHPGDRIVRDEGGFFHVVSGELFYALTGEGGNPDNARVEGDDEPEARAPDWPEDAASEPPEPPPAGGPPYSSAVLARSASAREQQAIYDANQPSPKSNP